MVSFTASVCYTVVQGKFLYVMRQVQSTQSPGPQEQVWCPQVWCPQVWCPQALPSARAVSAVHSSNNWSNIARINGCKWNKKHSKDKLTNQKRGSSINLPCTLCTLDAISHTFKKCEESLFYYRGPEMLSAVAKRINYETKCFKTKHLL